MFILLLSILVIGVSAFFISKEAITSLVVIGIIASLLCGKVLIALIFGAFGVYMFISDDEVGVRATIVGACIITFTLKVFFLIVA